MKKGYDTPKVELIKIDDSDLIVTSQACGHGDNGRGVGHGGGCDGVPGHPGRKTNKSAKNWHCR